MADAMLERLVADLSGARDAAAALAGSSPVGVRAIETAPGERAYLCAFDGPAFVALDGSFRPLRSHEAARRVASCALLVEHAEALVDEAELEELAAITGRVIGLTGDGEVVDAVGGLGQAAIELLAWRAAPERAVASLRALDEGIRTHDAARRAHERFVQATEPLVEVQDTLPPDLVEALRGLEEAAGRAGITTPLATSAGGAIEAIDAAADEILDRHLTPLRRS